MALRGDSIDNIPGAPGIGDKGSVEIIKRFGSVEGALERAAEVEKKTYRESLQNNRDAILFSKRMVTIDCNVPVDLDLAAMKTGAPDIDALRGLFTELEFTTLLKELLPVVEVSESHYHGTQIRRGRRILSAHGSGDGDRCLRDRALGHTSTASEIEEEP